jgi:predicted metal-binding membrane protein
VTLFVRPRHVRDEGSQTPGLIESTLAYRHLPAITLLIAVPLICWAWIVTMARDMCGPMSGASRWMMTSSWDTTHLLLLWAMWTVMMIGMMLPTAAALILVYAAAARRRNAAQATACTYALALGYLAVWAAFSVAATAAQRLLTGLLVLSPMMEVTLPAAAGLMLIIAGVYQFTPMKQACLRACQSPLGFLMRRWRHGIVGAFRLGLEHGSYCLGCCWALMMLLFVGGVMNLIVILSLTAVVAVEKIGPCGAWSSRACGVALVGLGLWMLEGVL